MCVPLYAKNSTLVCCKLDCTLVGNHFNLWLIQDILAHEQEKTCGTQVSACYVHYTDSCNVKLILLIYLEILQYCDVSCQTISVPECYFILLLQYCVQARLRFLDLGVVDEFSSSSLCQLPLDVVDISFQVQSSIKHVPLSMVIVTILLS